MSELWKQIQRHVGADDDGKPGDETARKIADKFGLEPPTAPIIPPGEIDARSSKVIDSLLPGTVQDVFSVLLIKGKQIAAEHGVLYKLISGTRTYAEQNALYAKGRTKPGPKVTNARGGYSNHNFGVASDGGWFGEDGEYIDSSNPPLAHELNRLLAEWAKSNLPSIEWGGDWSSFRDPPHFQYRTGLSMAEMRRRVASGTAIV